MSVITKLTIDFNELNSLKLIIL